MAQIGLFGNKILVMAYVLKEEQKKAFFEKIWRLKPCTKGAEPRLGVSYLRAAEAANQVAASAARPGFADLFSPTDKPEETVLSYDYSADSTSSWTQGSAEIAKKGILREKCKNKIKAEDFDNGCTPLFDWRNDLSRSCCWCMQNLRRVAQNRTREARDA
jgi:hypothetical protein